MWVKQDRPLLAKVANIDKWDIFSHSKRTRTVLQHSLAGTGGKGGVLLLFLAGALLHSLQLLPELVAWIDLVNPWSEPDPVIKVRIKGTIG